MDKNYKEVRIWQTHFSVHRPLENLPVPEMIVEEEQHKPDYRWDGKNRSEDGAQIVVTLSGSGVIQIEGREFSLEPGMAFLHNHNDPRICYHYPADGKEPWRFIWFAFYGSNSGKLVSEINQKYGYLFDVTDDSGLVDQLKEYKKQADVIQILQPLEGAMLVYSTLEKLCRQFTGNSRPELSRSIAAEVQRIIAADPAAELQVEKLAGNFNVSREHLSRMFHNETGVSLHEYIIRFRLRLAVDLLRRTRLSIKEVAFRCGWNDYSNFYRIFVKRLGSSPQKVRSGKTG